MNSQVMDEVFMSPQSAHVTALNSTTSQVIFKVAVASSILVAVTAGLFTSTTAVGANLSQDVQYVLALLNQAGYNARVTGTNMIINW